jgi:hypothetical protein
MAVLRKPTVWPALFTARGSWFRAEVDHPAFLVRRMVVPLCFSDLHPCYSPL